MKCNYFCPQPPPHHTPASERPAVAGLFGTGQESRHLLITSRIVIHDGQQVAAAVMPSASVGQEIRGVGLRWRHPLQLSLEKALLMIVYLFFRQVAKTSFKEPIKQHIAVSLP